MVTTLENVCYCRNGTSRVAYIPTDGCFINEWLYHYRFNPKRVENWEDDEYMVTVITVHEEEDRRFEILKGAHRWYKEKLSGHSEVLALIHTGLTEEQKSFYFREDQDTSVALNDVTRHRARIQEGNELAQKIEKIVTDSGFMIAHNSEWPNLKCVKVLYWMAKKPSTMSNALGLCHDLWTNETTCLKGPFLKGFFNFVDHHRSNEELDENMISKLRDISPTKVYDTATTNSRKDRKDLSVAVTEEFNKMVGRTPAGSMKRTKNYR